METTRPAFTLAEPAMKEFRRLVERYPTKESALMPAMWLVQDQEGYISPAAIDWLVEELGVSSARVWELISFYTMFRFTPMGKNRITICRGTACHVRGATRILEEVEKKLGVKEGETTEDLEYTLETAACIGCCALARCIMINDDVEAKLTPKKVEEFFGKEKKDEVQ